VIHLQKKLKNAWLRLLASKNPISRNLVALKRNYRLMKYQNNNNVTLEICGGKRPLEKHAINVDVLDYPTVDVLADLMNPLPFSDSSIGHIISIATLEHFNLQNLTRILQEFYRILKTNGTIEIGVPSLDKILDYYQTHGCDDTVLRYLHGALKDEHDIHLCVMDFLRFKQTMELVGFKHVQQQEYNYPRHQCIMMMKITAVK